MNVKNTMTLSDRHLRYAERMVEDGQFPSVEKVIEAGIDSLMHYRRGIGRSNDPLAGMADEICRRMEKPRDQWMPWDGDTMAERIKAELART